MIWPRDSIRARLIGLGAALTLAALVAGYLAIAAILEDFVAGRFDAETEAVADALIAGASIDAGGRLLAGPEPTDPRFQIPLSGWFWQLSQDGRVTAKSHSLFDNVLQPPDAELQGGPGLGPDGEALRNRPSRSGPETTETRKTCTGAELYREDGLFLAREAARAERITKERDFYYEQYERARAALESAQR